MAGSSWTNQVQNQVIIAGSAGQLLVYSGTPAANNLIASISAVNFTDPYGNAVLRGEVSYFHGASGWLAVQVFAGQIVWFKAASEAGPWVQTAFITISAASTILTVSSPGALTLSGTVSQDTAGGFLGTVPAVQTDTPASPVVVTQNTYQSLTNQYSIPGGDAQSGTVYRLTAWGDLTTPGSALQACRWAVGAFGTAAGSMAVASIAASALTASTTYEWKLTALAVARNAGVSGTIDTWISGTLSQFNTNLTGSNSYALTGAASGTTDDTTAASTFGLSAEWAAVETSQQVRYFGSVLERLGP